MNLKKYFAKIIKTISLNKMLIFIFIFILLTVIGTQAHELGHYVMFKYYGCKPELHYGMVSFDYNNKNLTKEVYFNSILAGPLQTIITGTVGFIVLLYRKTHKIFNNYDWIFTFLSLFWLREVFNTVCLLFVHLDMYRTNSMSDEINISQMLNLPDFTLSIVTGILGLLITMYVIFYIVPIKYRYNLILGGSLGSFLGFIIWFGYLGKLVLP